MDQRETRSLLLLFFISFILYAFPVFLSGGFTGSGIDTMIYTVFAKNILDNGLLHIPEVLNGEYDSLFFSPRYVLHTPLGLVQHFPPGLSIYLAFTGLLIFNKIAYAVPLSGALCIILFYFLVKKHYGREHGIVAAFLLITMPGYWMWSVQSMPEVPSTVILLAILLLIRSLGESERGFHKKTFMLGLLSGFWLWIRLQNAVLFPALIYLFLANTPRKNRVKGVVLACVVVCLFVGGLFLYNNFYFGGFLTSGYEAYQKQAYPVRYDVEEGIGSWPELIPFNSKALIKFFFRLPLLAPFILPTAAIAVLGLIHAIQKKDSLAIFTGLALISFILFFGNYEWFYKAQANDFSTQTSILRRVMPVFALLSIYVYPVLRKLFNGRTLYLIVFLIMVLNVGVTLFQPVGSLRNLMDSNRVHKGIGDAILAETSSEDVILTAFFGKTIFPERDVYSYGKISKYYRVTEMLKVTEQLIDDGKTVFFLDDLDYIPGNKDFETTSSFLEKTVYVKINSTGSKPVDQEIGFYRIEDVRV